jgi:uncharacterized protein (TIGR02300 family)
VAKPGLGTKRLCPHCGAKFYDLQKDPIVCPKCESVVEVIVPTGRGRPDAGARAAAVVQEVEPADTPEAEFVSLEDADAEASGGKTGEAEDDDVELEEDIADDTFLEEDEDENDDVSDIIGSDIEDEEET